MGRTKDKMNELDKEATIGRAKELYGAGKGKITDQDIHRGREKAFDELEKEIK